MAAQYSSEQFQRLMAHHGAVCSMSHSGNVWDNAAMESFFSSLKTEHTGHKTYRSRDEAKADVFDYIELIESPPIGVQIGIVRDTLPHIGFQLFRQPERKILALSPFRLGGEPNIRVGVAMITSASDALAFHDASFDEMWGRALKGQGAADLAKRFLSDRAIASAKRRVKSPNTGTNARRTKPSRR